MAKLDEIIAKFKEQTKSKSVRISISKGETSPFESNFGGTPYLPQGFEYPYAEDYDDGDAQIPMMLLAQINFEEIPHLENFPEKGILQIFINPTDDLCGVDFDNPTNQKDYKIFYHANIDKNPENQQKAPTIEELEESYLPVETPLKLSFKVEEQYMVCSDYRFEELFLKLYNEETDSSYGKLYDMPNKITNVVFQELGSAGHRIGGYPFFTQTDPKEYNEEYREYSTLLLQIDSACKDGEDLIMWGDIGIGNFFIKPEDLKNCKFDDVLYNWDCG